MPAIGMRDNAWTWVQHPRLSPHRSRYIPQCRSAHYCGMRPAAKRPMWLTLGHSQLMSARRLRSRRRSAGSKSAAAGAFGGSMEQHAYLYGMVTGGPGWIVLSRRQTNHGSWDALAAEK